MTALNRTLVSVARVINTIFVLAGWERLLAIMYCTAWVAE